MAIRPVDNTTMIPKTQKMSGDRQAEISKGEHSAYNMNKDFEKIVNDKQRKVMDTEETSHNRIRDEEPRDKSQGFKGSGEKKQKDEKKDEENKQKRTLGSRLDIRI